MRSFFRTSVVVLLAIASGAAAALEARTARIGVDGMVCAFCAQGIEKKLKARAEVERLFVSLEHRVVAVAFREGRTIADDELARLIVDAGYRVTGISRSDESIDAIRASVRSR